MLCSMVAFDEALINTVITHCIVQAMMERL